MFSVRTPTCARRRVCVARRRRPLLQRGPRRDGEGQLRPRDAAPRKQQQHQPEQQQPQQQQHGTGMHVR